MKNASQPILNSYEELLGKKAVDTVKNKATPFINKSILHVNATKFGGGVAEILQNMVAMMEELELRVNPKAL